MGPLNFDPPVPPQVSFCIENLFLKFARLNVADAPGGDIHHTKVASASGGLVVPRCQKPVQVSKAGLSGFNVVLSCVCGAWCAGRFPFLARYDPTAQTGKSFQAPIATA